VSVSGSGGDRVELRVVAAWRGGVQLLGPILHMRSMDETVDWARRVPFEARARIYPASTAPRARSRSVSWSSWSVLTHRA